MNDADLELTILDIANQGGVVAPINAWEEPLLRLTEQGFMAKVAAFNYIITDAGRAEFRRREREELIGVAQEFNDRARAQGPVIEGEIVDGAEEAEK